MNDKKKEIIIVLYSIRPNIYSIRPKLVRLKSIFSETTLNSILKEYHFANDDTKE